MSTLLSPGSQRRLPGVRFDVPAPALREVLPRMDIACFVGFAANGPVDVPVAVESLAAFEAVFGAELTLLHDAQGQPVRALLHPSVRQFFSQGGRRAWVIRVMGAGSVTTRFPVPRMLSLGRSDAASAWHIEPAFLQARSPGDWADALRVRCDTVVTPLSVKPLKLLGDDLTLQAHGPAALGVVVGDVLRLPVAEGEWVFGRVAQADAARNDADGRLQRVLRLHRMGTLRRWQGQPQASRMHWQEPGVRAQQLVQRHADVAEAAWLTDGRLRWTAHLPRLTQLEVGEPVRLSFQPGEPGAWAVIDAVQASAVAANGTVETQFVARPWRVPGSLARQPLRHWVAQAHAQAQGQAQNQGLNTTVQWLRSTLRVQHPDGSEARLDALALSERGERGERGDGTEALPTLPDDAAFFAPTQRQAFSTHGSTLANTSASTSANTPADAPATASALAPRFPLAAPTASASSSPKEGLWLPLDALPAAPSDGSTEPSTLATATDRGLGARGTDLPALLRNGLSRFGWTLFADTALADTPTDALAEQAQALRLLSRQPRNLHGLHAVLGHTVEALMDEPTLLLVPDAVQPGWERVRQSTPARVIHAAADPVPSTPSTIDGFADCRLRPLAAPTFLPDADPDAQGKHLLHWTAPEPGLRYELEESADADFAVAGQIYAGSDTAFSVIGKPAGLRSYRVRASDGLRTSPWSGRQDVRVGGSPYTVLDGSPADLLAVHRLMLRTAAGRGDVFALLGLPEAHRWPQALSHAQALRSASDTGAATPTTVPPLGAGEARALSHGSLQHAWIYTRRGDASQGAPLIGCPPDGAIAGQLAASALARGAWLAVANQPLKDVVAASLNPGTAERQALLDAQVNPVWLSPVGHVLGSADTLLNDSDWRSVNVRRLMCLLRRVALQRGAAYVFEPNGPALQRTVERAFNALLDGLFQRGAFAGRNVNEAFQVVVGEELNTPQRFDAGQFWVELRVAPALPLRFLTVRLLRSGERVQAREPR